MFSGDGHLMADLPTASVDPCGEAEPLPARRAEHVQLPPDVAHELPHKQDSTGAVEATNMRVSWDVGTRHY
jgi:hypothetical protein